MLLKVGELAKRTGLTVRTLHHYDAIGLLEPSDRSKAGYLVLSWIGGDFDLMRHWSQMYQQEPWARGRTKHPQAA